MSSEPSALKNPPWIASGDLMRIYACAGVVTLHTAAWVLFFQGRSSAETWSLNNFLSAACRWSVPVFIMLSGAIFLDRARPEPTRDFLSKRLSRVGIPLLFWSTIYFIYIHSAKQIPFSFAYDLRLLLKGVPYYHLYFLFVMIGLYLVTPALKKLFSDATAESRADDTLIILILASAAVMLNKYFAIKSANAFTLFIPFIGYYLAGFWLKDLKLRPGALALAWLVFAGAALITALEPRLLSKIPGIRFPQRFDQMFVYCNPVVILMSLSAFLIINNGPITKKLIGKEIAGPNPIFRTVAQATFGIYLIHPLILEYGAVFYYRFFQGVLPQALETPALALFTLLFSSLIIFPLIKAPLLKRLVS